MFSFWSSTPSGAVSQVGAKFHPAVTPAPVSASHISCAAEAGAVIMPMRIPSLRQ